MSSASTSGFSRPGGGMRTRMRSVGWRATIAISIGAAVLTGGKLPPSPPLIRISPPAFTSSRSSEDSPCSMRSSPAPGCSLSSMPPPLPMRSDCRMVSAVIIAVRGARIALVST